MDAESKQVGQNSPGAAHNAAATVKLSEHSRSHSLAFGPILSNASAAMWWWETGWFKEWERVARHQS